MIEVFVEYTGQAGRRTELAGGPFRDRRQAYMALIEFANANFGGFAELIQVIDAYGFKTPGEGIVRNEVHPSPVTQSRAAQASRNQSVSDILRRILHPELALEPTPPSSPGIVRSNRSRDKGEAVAYSMRHD